MTQTYTRQSSLADGDTITAALFNDEYNQLVNAFTYSATSSSTGHQHDGTAAEGGNVHTIGDLDFLNKIVADSTNNRWGVFVEVSSAAVEQLRISDGVISPVTDNDIDLGTSSLEFKDLFIDGTAHIDTLDVDVNGTVAGTFGVTGATTLSSTLAVTGAVTGSSTVQGTTITATTAFVPDASDGAALGTSSLEFSDLFLADGAVINFGDDQDVSLTHVADTGLLLSSTDQLQFGDSGTYIYQSADGVLDLVSDTEIEINATTIDINGNVDVSGTLTVAGAVDFGDAALSNVGAVQLDSIAGDGDTNTSITFSGSDVITIATGGSGRLTIGDGALSPVTNNQIDLGTSSLEFKDAFFDGTVTADAFAGPLTGNVTGNASGTALTVTQAAQTAITSVGTLTALTVDDVAINGKVITMTGDTSDTTVITAGTNGTLSIVTTDAAAAAANIQITADGTVDIDSAGVLTLDSGAAINIEPAAGSAILLDGTISVDAGVVTGATSITSTAFVGALTGNVTGNASGTAATVTTAAQSNITSLGTLTALTVDNLGVNGNTITANSGALNLTPASGSAIVLDGTINVDAGVVTGATSVTSTAFVGGLTGNVTGNASGTAATVTTAAQTNITSLGTLTTLTVDNVIINGTTIGHTGDTDLITVASGIATVAGEVSMTTLDIGGTNVTSTAAELNILDGVTSTAAELNALDGITAVVGELNALDIGSTAVGTAVASKAVILDSNKDYTGVRNLTISGELDAATLDISGAIDVAGTANLDVVDIDGAVDMASTLAVAGVLTGASLDISGDIDIDGTANLDIVDVDGAVNFAADVTYADGSDIITASAGTSNFRAGVNAGNSIESGGNYNVVVGDEAGTAITTGDRNAAVGYQALDATDTGSHNVAVGYQAATANSSGAALIAIGDNALAANTTANYNVAVGNAALKTNTTGANCVAVGADSLDANTTGSNNTAIGTAALSTNQTGISNLAAGTYALQASTAANNVGIGYSAGLAVSTGAQNTIIGTVCHDNLTTGSYCIALGYNNGPSAVDVDQEIVIGNSITGAGTNTVRIGTSSGGTATLGLDGSDTSWAAASDSRLKKDVADSTVGLSFLNDLRPITFKWQHKNAVAEDLPQYDADSSDPIFGEGKAHHGFIAQEVKAVIDDHSDVLDGNNIWHEDPDGTQQLSQGNLVPMLVRAIQELSAQVEELKANPRCKCNGE